jgi:hypothetical protein
MIRHFYGVFPVQLIATLIHLYKLNAFIVLLNVVILITYEILINTYILYKGTR